MIIVVVLPLTQLLVEQVDVVGYPVLVEQLVELLVIHAVRALDFTVESGRSRPYVDMPNVQRFGVPVKL